MTAPSAFDAKTRRLLTLLAVIFVSSLTLAGLLWADEGDGSDDEHAASTVSSAAAEAPATSAAEVPTTSAPAVRRAQQNLRTPTAEKPLRLWVGGDSLAAGPSWAVFEAARDTGVIQPLAEYQVGTGLVRSEYWDWHRHMDAVVRARDPQVVVFMVGANDNQSLAVGDTSYRPPAPEWVDEYRRRVGALMDLLAGDDRLVVWIGMPPMRTASYSESMGLVDEVFKSEAEKRPAVSYIDTWMLFSAPGAPGQYAHAFPDETGAVNDMRLEDGIHMNVAGSQFVARRVMEALGAKVHLAP